MSSKSALCICMRGTNCWHTLLQGFISQPSSAAGAPGVPGSLQRQPGSGDDPWSAAAKSARRASFESLSVQAAGQDGTGGAGFEDAAMPVRRVGETFEGMLLTGQKDRRISAGNTGRLLEDYTMGSPLIPSQVSSLVAPACLQIHVCPWKCTRRASSPSDMPTQHLRYAAFAMQNASGIEGNELIWCSRSRCRSCCGCVGSCAKRSCSRGSPASTCHTQFAGCR